MAHLARTANASPAATGEGRSLSVLRQLRGITGGRDRNEISARVLNALHILYHIDRGALYQYFLHANQHWLALNAILEISDQGKSRLRVVDPHKLDVHAQHELASQPHLHTPLQEGIRYLADQDGQSRLVYPLLQHNMVYGLVELARQQPFSRDELAELDEMMVILQDHLNLIRYAETDTLTGLLNRKTFDENLDRVLSGVQQLDNRSLSPEKRQSPANTGHVWLAAMDIDHFKRINDGHGHIIGDEVLILMAQLMRESFRLHDQLFRFGGEEFIAVIRTNSREATQRVLDRFRASVAEHSFPIVGKVTLSLGFTRVEPLDTPTELVARADAALYYAKKNGRNQVACYEQLEADGLVEPIIVPHKTEIELF